MRATRSFLLTTQSPIVSWSVPGTRLRSIVAADRGMFHLWTHLKPVLSSATSVLIKLWRKLKRRRSLQTVTVLKTVHTTSSRSLSKKTLSLRDWRLGFTILNGQEYMLILSMAILARMQWMDLTFTIHTGLTWVMIICVHLFCCSGVLPNFILFRRLSQGCGPCGSSSGPHSGSQVSQAHHWAESLWRHLGGAGGWHQGGRGWTGQGLLCWWIYPASGHF